MDRLEVGKVINTHGLRGEMKVQTWTDTPDVFADLDRIYVSSRTGDIELTVKQVKYQKNNIIVKFAEINTIEEAESFKNCILCADRSALGELPEGVYYIADLIGLQVQTEDGTILGTISDILQTGANDVYEVARPGGKPLLLPAVPDVVRRTDLAAGTVTVRLLEGLLDL